MAWTAQTNNMQVSQEYDYQCLLWMSLSPAVIAVNVIMIYLKTEINIYCYELQILSANSYRYQPSGEGGTRSPPATPHRLQNPKWPPGGPKMANEVWKSVHP